VVFMSLIFLRKFIYNIYEKILKNKDLDGLEELRKTQWFSEEKIKEFQWRRLENLLKHSYESVPYYKDIFNNLNIDIKNSITIEEFQKIPLLDKEIMTKNRTQLLSTRYRASDYIVDTTSGSTGKKLIFYLEKKQRRDDYFRYAAFWRCMEWVDVDIYDKSAKLWGSLVDLTAPKKIKNRLKKFIFPTLLLSSYNLTPEMMASYAKKIIRYKPKVIIGYSSALYLFAKYLEEKQIEIRGIKGVISSAETLYQHQRDIIESVFKCKVFNRYGSREFDTIAHECMEHKGLHISAENVFVEILDTAGNPCKPGTRGRIVITDLDNYVFPFIRYEIGDIGILSDRKCGCGRGLPLIEAIEGRTWDVIVGANGNQLIGSFWNFLIGQMTEVIHSDQPI
jgi:phenylacetate-CoA ligase